MKHLRPHILLAALASAAVLGCNNSANCTATVSPVAGLDGGGFPCVASEDCPRAGNTLVCVDNSAPSDTCVRCSANVCEVVTPEGCP